MTTKAMSVLAAALGFAAGAGREDLAEAADVMSDVDLSALPADVRALVAELRAERQAYRDRAARLEWSEAEEADLEALESVEAAYPV